MSKKKKTVTKTLLAEHPGEDEVVEEFIRACNEQGIVLTSLTDEEVAKGYEEFCKAIVAESKKKNGEMPKPKLGKTGQLLTLAGYVGSIVGCYDDKIIFSFIETCKGLGLDLASVSKTSLVGMFEAFKMAPLGTADGIIEEAKEEGASEEVLEKLAMAKLTGELMADGYLAKAEEMEALAYEKKGVPLEYEKEEEWPKEKAPESIAYGHESLEILLKLYQEGKISDDVLLAGYRIVEATGEATSENAEPEEETEKPTPGGRLLDV